MSTGGLRVPIGASDRDCGPLEGPRISSGLSAAYRDHSRAVFRAARTICGPAMAEEVTQEVFLHLWRHPEQFNPERGTLRSLLATIARHKAVDVVRAEAGRRGRENRRWGTDGPRATEDVDADLLRRETTRRVAEALGRLPRQEMEAIVTAFFTPCTYQEAAALLGQPEGTTKSRIRSGLHRLGAALADLPLDGPSPSRAS